MRFASLLVLMMGLGLGTAVAQPVDLRAAMLFDHQIDGFAASPVSADTVHTHVDPWLGQDKVLHAAGSFLITLSTQYVLQAKLDTSQNDAIPISAGVALGFGLAKEIADSRRPVNPFFSTRDLVADAVGVALAVGLILL